MKDLTVHFISHKMTFFFITIVVFFWVSLFCFFWWTCRMVSSPCWCLGQKTPNRRGTPAASGGNEIWDRPTACLPSGISETVWGHQHSTCCSTHHLTGTSGSWALTHLLTVRVNVRQQGHDRGRQDLPHRPRQAVNHCPCLLLRSSVMSSIGDWPDFHCVQSHRPPSTTTRERVWNRH